VRSQLEFSEVLGRPIRKANATGLGVPSQDLAIDALKKNDPGLARQYLRYACDEASRVHGVYRMWLRALLQFGEREIESFEVGVTHLRDVIGVPPPVEEDDDLGKPELERSEAAIDAGDVAAFQAGIEDLRKVQREVHDAQAAWCWGLLTLFRDSLGEDRMEEVLRVSMEPWASERYARLSDMSPNEMFELAIEGMRGHFCGPDGEGRIAVEEDDEKWVLSFDPCGSGGRMRRGVPERDDTSLTDPPYSFGHAERAHDWSWGRAGVCLYCAHCALVNEILPIEATGVPMRVTDYPDDPDDVCRWTIFKSAAFVPDWAYERVGKGPPPR
jgi:hypothetical protein